LGLLTDAIALAENPDSWPKGYPPELATDIAKSLGEMRDAVVRAGRDFSRLTDRYGMSLHTHDPKGRRRTLNPVPTAAEAKAQAEADYAQQ
jgi:hypothetical protein